MQSGHGWVTLYGRAFVLSYMFMSVDLDLGVRNNYFSVREAYCFLCCGSVFIAILQRGTFSLARTMLPWFLTLACHVTCTKVENTKAQAGQAKNRLPLVSIVFLNSCCLYSSLIFLFSFSDSFLSCLHAGYVASSLDGPGVLGRLYL